MHLTPAMVDDLMAIEPLAAHDLLNGLKQELPGLPVGRRHVPGAQRRARRSLPSMLNATCRLVVRQRSMAMDPWILDPQTAGETHKFLESTPLSFLRAGPPKFRRISAESRARPNFDKKIANLRQRGQYVGPSEAKLATP